MLPSLPCFLAYLAGILAALPPATHFIFPFFLSVSTGASAVWIHYRRKNRSAWQWLLLFALFPAGYFAPLWTNPALPASHILNHINETRKATVIGELTSTPVPGKDKIEFTVELKEIRYQDTGMTVSGRARLSHYHPGLLKESFQAGDRVRFSGVRLKHPRNFANPGRFDYKGYLERQGISAIGSLSKNSLMEKLETAELPVVKLLQIRLRGELLNSLERLFSGEKASLLKGMLLGEKSGLSGETRETYIATGLSHLMAVSGLHVGFVAFSAFALFWPLAFYACVRLYPDWAYSGMARKIAVGGCLLPVLFYLLIVGPKITALRAGFLILVFLAAILMNRERNLFNTLVIAAFLLLLWNPKAVLDVSFQLSFAAMLSILLASQVILRLPEDSIDRLGEVPWHRKHFLKIPFEEWKELDWVQKSMQSIKAAFAASGFVSLAVFLGTLPFVIFHFNRLSLIGLLLNPIMVPLASILIPLSLFTISLGVVFPVLGEILSFPLHLLLELFLVIPNFFSTLPLASIYVPSPPQLWIVLYYFVLIGGIWLAVKKSEPCQTASRPSRAFQIPVKISLGLASLGMILWLFWPRFPEGASEILTVSILDVGQGESIFIEFPNRETMILDGGGFYKNSLDVGKQVVAPFLWNRGIGHIDYLAVTHSDNDHISGLESLAGLFSIGHFLDGFQGLTDPRIDRLHRQLLAQKAIRVPFNPDTPLNVGEVRLVGLHPSSQFIRQAAIRDNSRAGNELSLVIRLEYREFSMLLTGDIGASTEAYLMDQSAPLRAAFLKSPHHGSRFSNSSRFIRTVQPGAVIFSSGYLNWMQHPDPEVIRRYEAEGTRIWRTDLNGSIHLTSDGYQHKIRNYRDLD